MTYSAISIANMFLELGERDNIPISPMKIQKLIYLAHGYYLYLYKQPLVGESFQAWKFGPVLPSIYHKCKYFDRKGISSKLLIVDDLQSNIEPPRPSDENVHRVVKFVWKRYSKYDPMILSQWTHDVNGPWAKAKKWYRVNQIWGTPIIDHESIREYFTNALNKTSKDAAVEQSQ